MSVPDCCIFNWSNQINPVEERGCPSLSVNELMIVTLIDCGTGSLSPTLQITTVEGRAVCAAAEMRLFLLLLFQRWSRDGGGSGNNIMLKFPGKEACRRIEVMRLSKSCCSKGVSGSFGSRLIRCWWNYWFDGLGEEIESRDNLALIAILLQISLEITNRIFIWIITTFWYLN